MIPPAFDYTTARSPEEAAALLQRHGEDAKVIAGGQSLVPLMRLRLAQPTTLVDIGRMQGCNHIRRENGTLVMGALVRHADIQRSDAVRQYLPLLAEMASEVGDNQVRNMGTIGGVLAHGDAAGDYNALALMLDATIVTTKRRHAAASFYKDLFSTALEPDEVITEVRFPVATGPHRYLKFRRRLYDWAIAGAAVQRTNSGWHVGLVNLATVPRRGTAVERALQEGAAVPDAAELVEEDIDPTADVRASAEFKRSLAGVLTRRALEQASIS